MNPSEVEDLLTKQAKLWPGWKPNAEEAMAWTRLLAAYSPELADRAFTATWAAQRAGNRPRPSVFGEQAKLLQANQPARHEQQAHDETPLGKLRELGYSGWWCVCMIAPDEYPALAGQYRTVTFPRGNPPDDTISKAMQQLQGELVERYPGSQWAIYRDCTWPDVQRIAQEARAAIGVRRDLPETMADWREQLAKLAQGADKPRQTKMTR